MSLADNINCAGDAVQPTGLSYEVAYGFPNTADVNK